MAHDVEEFSKVTTTPPSPLHQPPHHPSPSLNLHHSRWWRGSTRAS
jgi:hypothetical protein